MLLLARKVDEAILVGGVRILVTKITSGRVVLGFEAPKGVQIIREELLKPDSDDVTMDRVGWCLERGKLEPDGTVSYQK